MKSAICTPLSHSLFLSRARARTRWSKHAPPLWTLIISLIPEDILLFFRGLNVRSCPSTRCQMNHLTCFKRGGLMDSGRWEAAEVGALKSLSEGSVHFLPPSVCSLDQVSIRWVKPGASGGLRTTRFHAVRHDDGKYLTWIRLHSSACRPIFLGLKRLLRRTQRASRCLCSSWPDVEQLQRIWCSS